MTHPAMNDASIAEGTRTDKKTSLSMGSAEKIWRKANGRPIQSKP